VRWCPRRRSELDYPLAIALQLRQQFGMPNGDCTDFEIFGDVVVVLGYPIKKLDQFPLKHRRRQPSRPGGLLPVVLVTLHQQRNEAAGQLVAAND
jgi:hypothetical protein